MAMRNAVRRLSWCNNCKENSVVSKINKDKGYRFDYCINKGCGYKSTTPYPLTIHNADGVRVVNIEFKPYPKVEDNKPTTRVPYLSCGMDYDEAERYCEYVNEACPSYCTKDEQAGA